MRHGTILLSYPSVSYMSHVHAKQADTQLGHYRSAVSEIVAGEVITVSMASRPSLMRKVGFLLTSPIYMDRAHD
jgi:hypothetical protein